MRLLLHAGTHKTGTSTIQRVLHEHRDVLADAGVLYPDPRETFGETYLAHHPLVHAFATDDEDEHARARAWLDAVAAEAGDRTVLLSAEPVYRHVVPGHEGWWQRHETYLRRLADELSRVGARTEAVLVFRRRDTFVESIYHERVAGGFGRAFSHLLDHADRLLDYDRQLGQFAEAFPVVRRLAYEDLSGPELVDRFLAALGLDVPPLDSGPRERRSVDARLTLWMARAHRDDPDEDLVTQRRRFCKNPVSDELFEDYGRVSLWTDPQERIDLLASYGDTSPVVDDRAPVRLSPEDEARIDRAFDAYLEAKGLPPVGRSPAGSEASA